MDEVKSNRIPIGMIFRDMPVTRFHWTALSVLFLAFAIEAWEFMIPFFVLGSLMKWFSVGYGIGGVIMSAAFFGALLGAYVLTPLTDIIGRKKKHYFRFDRLCGI